MTYMTARADALTRDPGGDRSRRPQGRPRSHVALAPVVLEPAGLAPVALAREPAGPYEAGSAALTSLRASVPGVLEMDVREPDEEGLRDTLRQVQQTINQLSGLRSRIAGELEQRAIRAAGPQRRQQGLREARQQTGDDTRLSPSEVKSDGEMGRVLSESPAVQNALDAGRLPNGHARVLAKTLQDLGRGHPRYEQVNDQLVAAAQVETLKTFGRTCRRLLAAADQQAAQKKVNRDHSKRRLRVCETEGGLTEIHGRGTGFDAEIVHTALHAFARPQPNDTRAPEQRTWDALVATCRAALDAGAGTTNRAVRPHVLITVKQPDPNSEPATVEGAWTGPMPWTEARRHLVDAGVSGVLLDAKDTPIAVSGTVRTVPAGLWKALQVRDTTCIADGCDVPAAWCQIMHLKVPYRLGGKLSVENAAAGCTVHHRKLDHQHWQITWFGKRPVLHDPDRPPKPPGPPGPPPTSEPGDQKHESATSTAAGEEQGPGVTTHAGRPSRHGTGPSNQNAASTPHPSDAVGSRQSDSTGLPRKNLNRPGPAT